MGSAEVEPPVAAPETVLRVQQQQGQGQGRQQQQQEEDEPPDAGLRLAAQGSG